MPVTAPQAPPLADRPPAGSAPGGAVPVVRPRTVTAAGGTGATGGTGGTGEAALAVQRDARGRSRSSSAPPAPSTGAPAKEVPAPGRKRSSSVSSAAPAATASSAASGEKAARRTETPQDDPGLDLDDLARRLLDPMARLLRTELRRGRDRTGRPYDGRR
ncbi:hypothetical protein N4G66_16130 [Streptomyces rhizosphaerihabitans]|nr:hypothetical protein [Streptomyces rhizosphaerihabitans]